MNAVGKSRRVRNCPRTHAENPQGRGPGEGAKRFDTESPVELLVCQLLRSRWDVDNEYHVQDMLWVILAPVLPDFDTLVAFTWDDEARTE